ncbi:fluoride efflux transporter FluC [Streptomyces sp. TR02-1]|uniref:fluoride efflux transporter FluC n=1 Tax=Streptomyces sp. TR02-1 TaxID=3385977 RepID=UPI0039A21F25
MRGHGADGAVDPGDEEPVDPDVDLHLPQQRAETLGHRLWHVLAAVACGGALGALARHGVTSAFPAPGRYFPWGVFSANAAGCALIGAVTVLVTEIPPGPGRVRALMRHSLARPFLGVGVLGGFTTFSSYALGAARLLEEGHAATAFAYLAGMPAAALVAVALTTRGVRNLVRRGPLAAEGERP